MKKFAYNQPEAEMVLLQEDDVICTSLAIKDVVEIDDEGIPKTTW